MRLTKFQIQNYCSIIDSGIVDLSENDNVSVFAGQNESGKSSMFRALYDFERVEFNPDSMPFSTGEKPIQTVSCTYKVEKDDNTADILSGIVIDEKKLEVAEKQEIFDENNIKKIQEFTITKTKDNGNNEVELFIDENSFKIFQSSILEKSNKNYFLDCVVRDKTA